MAKAVIFFQKRSSFCFLRKIHLKFFPDFISCCVPMKQRTVVSTSSLHIKEEKSKEFVQLSYAMGDVKRSKRPSSLGSGTTQWRPSLCMISEDNVVSTVSRRGERMVRSGKQVEGKRRRTVKIQTYDDQSTEKRTSVSAVIPAFSPTVFLF
ncbi:hypothetical protein AQUCO_00500398v1 [Aquilegia coerulea]|uniref:Uncharacterized protein n=1 Tax=Aquilegia coerulea TaxID=218851 RepID=A0A2G5ERR3_AQUCA|nr:hypothetical protein AQUCO_00500398v1 [Aquilegia coerulea]